MLRENLTLARPFLALLAVFAVGRWVMGVREVDYSRGHHIFSLVTLTVFGSAFYCAFLRRWLGFGIMRCVGMAMLLAFFAQAVIFVLTGLSYGLGLHTYFNHPTALNVEAPIGAGEAMLRRLGGLTFNTLSSGIIGALGWSLGAILPDQPAPRTSPRPGVGVAASLVVLALLAPPAWAADLAAERATLMRIDKEWAQAAAARDAEKVLSFWAEDARVYPPGQPVVAGKDALRRFVTDSFAIPGFAISWETTEFVVSAGGDLAYGTATNKVTFPGPQGSMTEVGRAVTVWKKGADKRWRCVIDIWNAEPKAPPK